MVWYGTCVPVTLVYRVDRAAYFIKPVVTSYPSISFLAKNIEVRNSDEVMIPTCEI